MSEQREKLIELLAKHFDIGDSYVYNLTRDKTAFMCGTMGFDDFEEFDEETVADIADHLLAHGVIVLPCKVGDTVYKICPVSTFIEFGDMRNGYIVKTECDRCGYRCCDCTDIGYQKDARNVIVERKMTRLETIVRCMPYFGKIYFLTREEAEAALKEGQSDVDK